MTYHFELASPEIPPIATADTPDRVVPAGHLPTHVVQFVQARRQSGAFCLVNNERYTRIIDLALGLPSGRPADRFIPPRGTLSLRPAVRSRPQGMTRSQLDQFCESARKRGFDRVLTRDGPVPLARWRPWGVFCDDYGRFERFLGGLHWVLPNIARDVPTTERWLALGVWTFLPTNADLATASRAAGSECVLAPDRDAVLAGAPVARSTTVSIAGSPAR
jgi:hypothetical protein